MARRDQLEQRHTEARGRFDAAGMRTTAEARTSGIIVKLAEERRAVLIVMGQRERLPLGTLLLGSVARGVLNFHHRPVMLVGSGSPGIYPRSGA